MLKDIFKVSSISDHYFNNLVKFLEGKSLDELPHLFLYGTPGTGKTFFAHLVADHYLGADKHLNFYEYNSSMDRGIDVIRGPIKDISSSRSITGIRKIILLDEADYFTNEAQASLRRVMETGSALFILTANYEHKLLPAIKSRCSSWNFTGPDPDWIRRHATEVDQNVLDKAIQLSGKSFRDLFHNYDRIKSGDVTTTIGGFLTMSAKDFIANSWKMDDVSVIIKELHSEILNSDSKFKAKALIDLADVDYRCSLSTNKYLQIQTGFIKVRNTLKGTAC